MNKKITVSVWLTTLIIAITVTFSITMTVAMRRFDSTVASVQEKEQMYSKIAEIDKYVRANDYYDIDEQTLQDTISSAYVFGTGDKDAKYYTAAGYTALLDIQSGKTVGIGVDIAKDPTTGYAKVLKVYAGSPAEDLGIKSGFYMTKIGEVDTKTLASTQTIESMLLGDSGTSIAIEWLDATMKETSGTATRRNYTTTTVDYQALKEEHGYIKIRSFDERTSSELDFAMNALENMGVTNFIFDLRDNDDGDLDAAIACIKLVCASGEIGVLQYSNGTKETLGRSDNLGLQIPAVCLVNGKTSNAAEVFAASLKTLSEVTIVGTQTAGKGTVQSVPHRLSDGSAIVLTVGKILTADGTSFDGTGLTVDVERTLSADEQAMYYNFTLETDPQLLKAIAVAESVTGSGSTAAVTQKIEAAASSKGDADADEEDVTDAPADGDAQEASSDEQGDDATASTEEDNTRDAE